MKTKEKLNRFIYLDNTYKDLLETLHEFELDWNIKEISISQISCARFKTWRVKMADVIFKERFWKMLKDMIIEVEIEMSTFFYKNLEE